MSLRGNSVTKRIKGLLFDSSVVTDFTPNAAGVESGLSCFCCNVIGGSRDTQTQLHVLSYCTLIHCSTLSTFYSTQYFYRPYFFIIYIVSAGLLLVQYFQSSSAVYCSTFTAVTGVSTCSTIFNMEVIQRLSDDQIRTAETELGSALFSY